jgi:hypothetical protein
MLWPVEEVEALRVEKPVFFKEKILSWGQRVEVVGLQTAQVRGGCAPPPLPMLMIFL